MRVLFAALLIMLFAAPALAETKAMSIELADDRVDISTGFDGSNITLFGTIAADDADLIVTLKGPEHTMKVRRKGRVLGAWMNNRIIEFRRVPSYYDYATTMSEGEMATHSPLLKDNEVGVDNLGFYPEDDKEEAETLGLFRDALIRNMQERGFYPLKAHEPEFVNTHFFKTKFDLPPGVPTGLYKVEAVLVKGGSVLAKESKTLHVGQVGFNARVYLFAQDHSFLYGLFAVVLALVCGWSAFTFLRRD